MNREIKFRVWDKLLREMNYIDLCDLAEGDDYWYDGETSVWEVMNDAANEQSRYVIQQYTGLKDKNGKEIYEGDIVRKCNVNYIVMFDPQGYWCLDGNGALNSEMLSSELPHFEVIGNIYESEVEDEKINC